MWQLNGWVRLIGIFWICSCFCLLKLEVVMICFLVCVWFCVLSWENWVCMLILVFLFSFGIVLLCRLLLVLKVKCIFIEVVLCFGVLVGVCVSVVLWVCIIGVFRLFFGSWLKCVYVVVELRYRLNLGMQVMVWLKWFSIGIFGSVGLLFVLISIGELVMFLVVSSVLRIVM